jgi:PAS domain S-box-containing protein
LGQVASLPWEKGRLAACRESPFPLEKTVSQQRPGDAAARGPWFLATAGVILFGLTWLFQGDETGYWLPGLGLGIALVSWLGWRILPVLSLVLLLVRSLTHANPRPAIILGDTVLHTLQIGISWWLYHHVARGSRWLDDPRSATIFLILVPGGLSAFAGLIQASYHDASGTIWMSAAQLWLSRMVGVLVVVPFLLATCTPILLRHRLVDLELPPAFFGERESGISRVGDRIELAGLTFATSVLAVLLLWTHAQDSDAKWTLWASCLVLIVWTCIRQGLSGACFSAGVTSVAALTAAQILSHVLGFTPDKNHILQIAVQADLLAFCSSALLVGVSTTWIRANETRYRHVVSRIPFVVYSARLPHGFPGFAAVQTAKARRDNKFYLKVGPSISKLANVLLVSPACKQVFGCEPESMIGPFERWLERIVAEDRELVIAALAQLCLQEQPVTCEYRLRPEAGEKKGALNHQAGPPRFGPLMMYRWLRDTLTPHYSEEGLVDGWEGLVEDITEQRALSHNLRQMTSMLQVLVSNLPTGVYFVQAPMGHPILVNSRARQLLGQREDLSAGLATLSKVFRLHRPDGTEYPWQELPVCKALREGIACRTNDIVVHRGDGRKTPLITWAAPINLHNTGVPDAAVWVLEDWSAMQQAELALRESEYRLRAVIETMGEGMIVQNDAGVITDCNPAACTILGLTREQLIHQSGLVSDSVCLKEDKTVLPREEQPDWQALRTRQPARGVILGIPSRSQSPSANGAAGTLRWLLVNCVPLPVGPDPDFESNSHNAGVVTTFADITRQLESQNALRLYLDKYQNLVEALPFVLIQRDRDFNITYLNPAATLLTGHSMEDLLTPGSYQSIIHPDDLPMYRDAAQEVGQGKSTRIEGRLRTKEGSFKTVLAFFHPNLRDGEVVGSTCLVVDITVQPRLEEDLLRAKNLQLVGRLASGIVHDFNNLVMVLMGLAGCAKSQLPPSHPAWQYLSRIEDAGEQASHLAGQLLTFTKQRPRQARPVNLNTVVTQTLKLARSVMPASIAVETSLDEALAAVLGDENQLKQVVMNLCLNARDAMSTGGKLTIRTERAPLPNSDGRIWVHLAIQDTGHGMEEDVRSRVFEPFFSTKERGTGLGLAVVHQIIKESDGILEVCSKPGMGTRFDIWLRPNSP